LISIFEKSVYDLSNIGVELADQQLTELEKLNCLLDFYAAKLLEDGASTYIMLQEQLLRSIDRSTQLSREINEKQFNLFQGIVNSGIVNGSFRADVNTRMIFYTLLGTFRHVVIVNSGLWIQDNPVNQPQRFQSDVAEANIYLKFFLKQMLLV